MRLRRLLVVMLALLALAACARQAPRYAAAPQGAMRGPNSTCGCMARRSRRPMRCAAWRRSCRSPRHSTDGPYTLDSGDKLRIVVFGQDRSPTTTPSMPQGTVTPAAGRRDRGARPHHRATGQRHRRRGCKSGYVRDPSVAVEIETYRPFFVLGEVTFPGQYPYVPNMTVENAIAIAGGFTPRASKDKVTITRKVQGAPTRFTLPLRYPLRPGDTIEVSERWF